MVSESQEPNQTLFLSNYSVALLSLLGVFDKIALPNSDCSKITQWLNNLQLYIPSLASTVLSVFHAIQNQSIKQEHFLDQQGEVLNKFFDVKL